MSNTVNAATLAVRVVVESSAAASDLRALHAQVQQLGSVAIPDQLQQSIAEVGNAASTASIGVKDFAVAQQQLRVDKASSELQNLSSRLEIAQQRLSETSAKYGENAVQTKNAALAVETLSGKINNANSNIELQKSKLDALKSSNIDAATAAQLLSSQYGNTATAIAVLTGKIEQGKAELKENKAALDLLKTGADQAKPAVHNLTVEVTALASSGGRINAFAEIAIGGLRNLGAMISANLIPAFKDVIGIGADYQSSMAMFATVSGASADQMARASETAQALGADMGLPATSASGAASAMTELSKAGLSATESMDAARGTLQLAAAGMLSEAEAAQYTSAALNAFNLEGGEATRVADLLAASVAASGSSVQQTGYAVQQSAAVYAAAGVPIQDMIILINELSASGIKGSDAGTSLKTMILSLQNPSKESAGILRELNVSLYDSAGAMRPLRDVIGDLSAATANLTQEQKDGALATIFGSDAVRAANIVVRNGTDGWDSFAAKTQKGGDAGRLAGAQMTGLGGAMAGLRSQLETAALNGITPLLPLLEKLVRGAADLAGKLANNIGPAVADFVTGLGLVADGAKVAFDWIGDNGTAILMTLDIVLGTAAVAMTAFGIATGTSAVSTALAATGIGGLTTSLTGMIGKLALAASPWVVLAAAIYGAWEIANKYQEVQKQIHDGIDAMLTGKVWWNDASDSLERFRDIQGGASATTRQTATELETLQAQLKELTTAHTAMAKNTDISAEANAEFTRRELELKAAIEQKTTALNSSVAADRDSNAAVGNSLAGLRDLREGATTAAEGVTVLNDAFKVTPEVSDAANKAIEKAYEGGISAFGDFLSNTISFQTDSENRTKTHNDKIAELEVEKNNAVSEKAKAGIQLKIEKENEAYAEEQVAAALNYTELERQQNEHLGRMLLDWINAQAMLDPEFAKVSDQLKTATAERYGIQVSAAEMGFGGVLGIFNDYKNGVINGEGELNLALNANEAKYKDVAMAASELQKEYVTEITAKFQSGGYSGTPEEAFAAYQKDLDAANTIVNTQVNAYTADAEKQMAIVKMTTDRIDRKIDIAVNGESTQAIQAANGATKAVLSIPQSRYIDIKDNAIVADGHVKTLTGAVNAIPKTTTTTATLVSGNALTQANVIGGQMSDGLAAGISSRASAVAAAMAGSVLAAVAAARVAAATASPSKKTAEIGGFMGEGLAVGITAKGADVSNAMTAVVGKGVSKATIAAAEGVGKIAETVSKAVDALNSLNSLELPTTGTITAMAESLNAMVTAFAANVVPMKAKAQEALGNYADMVGKIVGVIGEGADALTSLTDFIAPADIAINSFMASLGLLIYEFGTESADANAELFDASIAFAETAGAAIAIIADGVTAFEELRGFAPVAEIDIKLWTLAVRDLVRELGERTKEVNLDLLDASNDFTDTAGAAVGIISDGVDAFAKLENFAPVAEVSIALFSLALRDVVRQFSERTKELDTDLFDVTNAFVETAGGAVSTIADGIDAFIKLQTFTGVPEQALRAFADGLRLTVALMIQMTAEFDADGVSAAAAFADSAGRIIAPIKEGVDAFTSLAEYKGLVPGVMDMFMLDMQHTIALMVQIAATADIEGVKAAAEFSTSVSTVFDGLSSGIDALDAISSYEGIAPDRMGMVVADMSAAIGMIQQLAGMAQAAAGDGETWKKALESFASNIRAGLSAISSIDGLSVNVSASVSASAGGGTSDGGDAIAVDGSHADGLARVPRDGYIARLHEDERVLSAENARRQDQVFGILAEMTGGTSGTRNMSFDASVSANTGTTSGQDKSNGTTINVIITDNLDKEVFFYELMERINRN